MSNLFRKIISLTIFLCFNAVLYSQTAEKPARQFPLTEKIPVDSAVKIGKLKNGLTYYIRKNFKPEKRADLQLAVKAGSILEDNDQQGLAHFVEHMAFNGTKNFEKNEIVNFLESIGMQFGPEVNAYTSFDETVYMLEVPTDSAEILKKAFLILEDWAHNVSFDSSEIDKERGVVIEEWRLGRGAGARMRDKHFPVIFKDSRYAERLPIGKKEILETFKHETLKRFYNDWYRPDLIAVIAVGDFDVDAIEKLIIKHFSEIPAKDNPRKRELFPVPDYNATQFSIASDKEATRTSVEITSLAERKYERNVEDYRQSIVRQLFIRMLNDRYYEISRLPDPPYNSAGAFYNNYVLTKDAFSLSTIIKDNDIYKGTEVLLREMERVKQYGFTQSELDRKKRELLRSMEKLYSEIDKIESDRYTSEYIEHFLSEVPIPGIEYEYKLINQLVPEIKLDDVNKIFSSILNDNNRVVVINLPEKENVDQPDTSKLLTVFSSVQKEILTPYEDKVSDDDLLNAKLNPAKIVDEKEIKEVGVTELTLANGIRVILKPTDFKNDDIQFSSYSPGGNSLVNNNDYISASVSSSLVTEGGVGQFNKIDLQKKLADKVVRVSPWIGELAEGISGSASLADAETMFELIYLYFTAPRKDSSAFLSFRSRFKTLLENRTANPRNVYQDTIQAVINQYNFRYMPWTTEKLSQIDLNTAFSFYKDRFTDASDFTFIFVGSFEIEKIKPLIQTYLGNLPSIKRKENWKDVGRSYPKGIVEKQVRKGIEPQSLVTLKYTGPFQWSNQDLINLNALTSVLEIQLREILREDKGGTYGVGVWADPSRYPKEEYEISISFGCNPDKAEEFTKIILNHLDSLKSYGTDSAHVAKVKEINLKTQQVNLKKNDFWLSELVNAYYNNEDPRQILEYEKIVESLSPQIIQEAAKKYFNTQNYVKVILYPESVPN